MIPKCGDHVHHEPSGEDWIVAWCEGDDLAPAGWPNSLARLSDCRITRRLGSPEHILAVLDWVKSPGNDSRKSKVERLYPEAWSAAVSIQMLEMRSENHEG